ncbi:MAG TPA: precorrin-3B C(17)-methyltransferase [Spirochaetia bacterium]|nr:precorrin-3B C(17)-methyltransferase [Spirochaetia bacterium]
MVGTGPGAVEHMTGRAVEVVSSAEVIVGYRTYIDLLGELVRDKQVVRSGMRAEVDRCREAVDLARAGHAVAMVSGGDPGVYGMAGLVLEIMAREDLLGRLPVEIVPGVTSATAAAACLGAPLSTDFAVISLSDLLTPWNLICRRLTAACAADFVLVLYNPASRRRVEQIKEAQGIMLAGRSGATPVGLVRNATRPGQSVVLTDLAHLLEQEIDMFTTVVVGNSTTFRVQGCLVTPRGYPV